MIERNGSRMFSLHQWQLDLDSFGTSFKKIGIHWDPTFDPTKIVIYSTMAHYTVIWLPKPGFDIHKGSGSMHIVFDLSCSRYTNQPPNRINAFGPMPHWAKRCRQRTAWWLHHNRHCRPSEATVCKSMRKTTVRQNRKRFRCYFQHAKQR